MQDESVAPTVILGSLPRRRRYLLPRLNNSSPSVAPEVQSVPSNLNLEDQEGASGNKIQKQSQMAAKISEFIEYRKIQIDEKKKQEDDYCVEKCIDVVDGMEDLTDEQKADANELFQSEMNRQIFMKTKKSKCLTNLAKEKNLIGVFACRHSFLSSSSTRYVCLSSLFSPLIALDHRRPLPQHTAFGSTQHRHAIPAIAATSASASRSRSTLG